MVCDQEPILHKLQKEYWALKKSLRKSNSKKNTGFLECSLSYALFISELQKQHTQDSLTQNMVSKYVFKEKELMPDTLVWVEGLTLVNKNLYHP